MMEQPERKWTMVIDLDKCTGCAACVVACHAENNVPIASEREVTRGRGQHWIRIERYWSGEYPDVRVHFLPILCQHCDSAPCEPVCPAYATVHSDRENLNLQVYNRCIGTRYCANNCPYKVRFFNYFDPSFPGPFDQQLNPDVTVRSAGVMEKCTFCVQRIRRAEETALSEGRPLGKDEVVPACVQTCPTGALVFGNLYDPESPVTKLLEHNARKFRLMEHLGTQPSVYYLKGGTSDVGT
jgi:molybdopterin-containing oxidoreductase family iron-sulfur binding subunit